MKIISLTARIAASTVSLATLSIATCAVAQSAPADSDETKEIVVTGTAIKGVAPVGSATVTLDRATIVESGIRDVSQLVSNLPQGSSLGTSQNSTGGRQQGVNLRGLGNNATLLLFDNHRWVNQGVANQVPDPSVIPFAAVERLEVVTDGASAIYGSDAVAGVVNYILRKDYEGAEVTARYTSTLYHQLDLEGVAGHKWDGGGFIVGFKYEDRDRVKMNARPYLRQNLLAYGGNDSRLSGAAVVPGAGGALVVGTNVYGLPITNGVKPTAAQLVYLNPALAFTDPATYKTYDQYLFDTADFYDFFASRKQISALFKAHQRLGDSVEAKLTLNYNRREGTARATEFLQGFSVPLLPTSPSYISLAGLVNPTAAVAGTTYSATQGQNFIYNLGLNFASNRELTQRNKEDTFNSTFEIDAKVFGDYSLDSYVSFGQSTGCNVCQAQVNTIIAQGFGAGITTAGLPVNTPNAGLANPLTSGGLPNPIYNATFNPYLQGAQPGAENLIAAFLQEGDFKTLDIGTQLSGSLFQLPAGTVKVAVGGEYSKTWFNLLAQNKLNVTNGYQIARNTDSGRVAKSLFAEAYIPVLETLDVTAAVRFDAYSDFIRSFLAVGAPKVQTTANTFNPKFGFTWQPVNGLKIRGNWGTSFRMPTLIENNPATLGQTNRSSIPNGTTDIPITNAANGTTLVLNRIGNTPGLKPESAKTWSLGMDYTPEFAPGLKFGVTYYNVDYMDRIENLPNQTATTALVISSPTNQALFKDYFIVAHQPTTCVNGNFSTYNPLYLPFLNDPNAVFSPFTTNDCQLEGIVNGGRQNLGRVKQSGLDFNLAYKHDVSFGTLSFSGNFSKILNLKKSLTRSGPLFDALDTFGFQVSSRANAAIGLKSGGFNGRLSMNYVGSYLNNATITVNAVKKPDTKIPAWTTFDANVAYDFGDDTSGILGGLRMAVGIQNLTDKAPPIVLSGTTAWDANNHNVWGRIWTFELTKKF